MHQKKTTEEDVTNLDNTFYYNMLFGVDTEANGSSQKEHSLTSNEKTGGKCYHH